MKRNGKIGVRIMAVILPVVIVGLVILTGISILFSRQTIEEEIETQLYMQLTDQKQHIEDKLTSVKMVAEQLADVVGNSYTSLSLKEYESMLGKVIYSNDMVMGSGIWFEPYVYDRTQKYVGPYIYKDGENAVVTYDYSNAEYDYFAYEFYTNVTNGTNNAVFTEPYYDATSDTVMSSCSAPIYTPDGKFIGVVTADINLETIQKIVSEIKIGENGGAFLLNKQGQYLVARGQESILEENITDSSNESLKSVASQILSQESGNASYIENAHQFEAYFATVGDLAWKLVLLSDYDEQMLPLRKISTIMIIVAVVVLLILIGTILIEVTRISRQIGRVSRFAMNLSQGDFTIPLVKATQKDELGTMGKSLNDMYTSNKKLITDIADHGKQLEESGIELERDTKRLEEQFKNMEALMRSVKEDMVYTGNITEQMGAAVGEVRTVVSVLSQETAKSANLANEIRSRAAEIERNSQKSYEQASSMGLSHERSLDSSIRNAEVVKSVGEMAEVISGIASQINLLSLNASIEAARAGEMGKGFAVVAGEIGKLSGDTSYAVNQIKETIEQVEDAFQGMVDSSHSLLHFIQTTVTPDYDMLIEIAKQYGEDAIAIESYSKKIEEMMNGIESSINQVGGAVDDVAESSQNTIQNGNDILQSIQEVSQVVQRVSKMSVQQERISSELAKEVSKFKIQ